MKLIFATSNSHKLQEVKKLLPADFEIADLASVGIVESIPETGSTFVENAFQKARFVFKKCGLHVLADDSGLEVHSLGGRPGVYSARYSGLNATDSENIAKLLVETKGISDRKARFVAIIALIINGEEHVFEGISEGHIALTPSGKQGFGYDPVFIPEGYQHTFAELPSEVKSRVGHRGKAIRKLVSFLQHSGH